MARVEIRELVFVLREDGSEIELLKTKEGNIEINDGLYAVTIAATDAPALAEALLLVSEEVADAPVETPPEKPVEPPKEEAMPIEAPRRGRPKKTPKVSFPFFMADKPNSSVITQYINEGEGQIWAHTEDGWVKDGQGVPLAQALEQISKKVLVEIPMPEGFGNC